MFPKSQITVLNGTAAAGTESFSCFHENHLNMLFTFYKNVFAGNPLVVNCNLYGPAFLRGIYKKAFIVFY